MGMGSNTTPPWVDEEIIDRKKKKRIDLENSTIIKNLRIENESLKKRIKQLEDKLKRINK
ncbi:MAG: hypothetical protein NWF10_06935 [Candidatus Bathyarchaeota archaeon]|nr:hypothetical protein [Candidatus Bathyarchaeota archaeon]